MPSPLTPVKVRGKRSSSGKQALPPNVRRSAERSFDGTPAVLRRRRQAHRSKQSPKAKQSSLSQLEQLPTELIELIFLASGNVDLPFVSRTLCLRLSSKQLRLPMVDNILSVLLLKNDELSAADIYNLQRLLDRRCFTWLILRQWIDRNIIARLPPCDRSAFTLQFEYDVSLPRDVFQSTRKPDEIYYAIQLGRSCGDALQRLRIPIRAFTSPWTDERFSSLAFWYYTLRRYKKVTRHQGGQARDAVEVAIQLHFPKAAMCFMNFHGVLDQQLFESTVMYGGFDKRIVSYMLSVFKVDRWLRAKGDANCPSLPFDPLSPTLWRWADEPAQAEDGSGAYLKDILKKYMEPPDAVPFGHYHNGLMMEQDWTRDSQSYISAIAPDIG